MMFSCSTSSSWKAVCLDLYTWIRVMPIISVKAFRKGLKYGPLQKLRGVIATSSESESSNRDAKATKAVYRLLVSMSTVLKSWRVRESLLILRYGGLRIVQLHLPTAGVKRVAFNWLTADSIKSSHTISA